MYKRKEGIPTFDYIRVDIADNCLKRPSLKKVVERVNQIAQKAFEEIAPKYQDSDFYGWIETEFEGGEYYHDFECETAQWRCYEEGNAHGDGYIDVNTTYSFFLPAGREIKRIYMTFRFSNLPDKYTGPIKDFFWEMNDRIIHDAMQSIPTGTRYYDRLARKAKRLTAFSLIRNHSPLIFELDIEASLFAKRYGFVSPSEQAIFRKALKELRASGLRV